MVGRARQPQLAMQGIMGCMRRFAPRFVSRFALFWIVRAFARTHEEVLQDKRRPIGQKRRISYPQNEGLPNPEGLRGRISIRFLQRLLYLQLLVSRSASNPAASTAAGYAGVA